MKEIIKLNDLEKYEQLTKIDKYWKPDIRPSKYSEWVMQNYTFDLDDALVLCIYSLLLNVPIKDLREKMSDCFEPKIKGR